jgi:hypothetical protein
MGALPLRPDGMLAKVALRCSRLGTAGERTMPTATHQLRYDSLFQPGRGLVFPCDAQGRVPLDALSERARRNYLYARAVVGREYATPAVIPPAAS